MVGMQTITEIQHAVLACAAVATTRATFTMEETLAEQARRLDVNVSAAARDGVAAAVRDALAAADRAIYEANPETEDDVWTAAEAWSLS